MAGKAFSCVDLGLLFDLDFDLDLDDLSHLISINGHMLQSWDSDLSYRLRKERNACESKKQVLHQMDTLGNLTIGVQFRCLPMGSMVRPSTISWGPLSKCPVSACAEFSIKAARARPCGPSACAMIAVGTLVVSGGVNFASATKFFLSKLQHLRLCCHPYYKRRRTLVVILRNWHVLPDSTRSTFTSTLKVHSSLTLSLQHYHQQQQ